MIRPYYRTSFLSILSEYQRVRIWITCWVMRRCSRFASSFRAVWSSAGTCILSIQPYRTLKKYQKTSLYANTFFCNVGG